MTWIALAALAGFVGLDATSFPQIMISRPLVAALLVGLLLGRPEDALLLGVALETFALVILPIGAARHPEAGVGAVAATAGYLLATPFGPSAPALLFAVTFGLGWERLAGYSVNLQRRANAWLVGGFRRWGRPSTTLERRHGLAMLVDFTRAAIIGLAGSWIALLVVAGLTPLWSTTPVAAATAVGVAATAMLAASSALFGGWTERGIAIGSGIVAGLLLVLVR
jgi:hypothetical protein